MKKILFALTMMAGLVLPLAPRAQAESEVALNLFYDNLSTEGNWIEVADYGYCFQPNVASGNQNWRPYSDGYWAYTDVGWTWVSYEDFGWATYHYGRWSRLADYGWVWVPGYEWAPAWVSWRTGGDYIGWAPLPPAGGDQVYEGRAITGQVDVEFDIGPQYYNFVDVRYIGEPVLRERIFEPSRNVTIISNTVNVTNITYNNSTVYNYGPDYNRVNQYSTRPIQRLTLQRETTVDVNLSAQGGGRRNLNRVNGNQFTVVAPVIRKSSQQIAPRQVKAKVEKPIVERGWQGISNREQVQAEMKKEDAKKIAPPSFQPQKGRKTEAVAGNAQNRPTQPNDTSSGNKNQPAERTARQGRESVQGQNPDAEARPAQENASGNQADQAGTRANRKAAREQKAQAAEPDRADAQNDQAQPADQRRGRRAQKAREQSAREPNQEDQNTKLGAARAEKSPAEEGEPAAAQTNRSERADRRQERKAEQPAGENPDRPRAGKAERAAPADTPQPSEEPSQPRRTRQAGQDRSAERPERVQPSERAQQPDRAQQADRPEPAQRDQQADRPQPPRQTERGQQAERPQGAESAPQSGEQNPDARRKAKKKKQQEETPEQPQP